MDLQKAALQANGNVNRNGQHTDARQGEGGNAGLPFADFIRPPTMDTGALFASLGRDATNETAHPTERQDAETGRDHDTDDSAHRTEAPDSSARENNARENNTREENTANEGRETNAPRNEPSHDDNQGRDDAPDQRPDQETDNDQSVDPQDSQDAATGNAGQDVATENADTDVTESNTDTPSVASASATTDNQAAIVVDAAPAINAALQNILQTTRETDPELISEEVLKAVKEVITNENVQRAGETGNRQNTSLNPEAEAELVNAVRQALQTLLNPKAETGLNTANQQALQASLNPKAEAGLNTANQQALHTSLNPKAEAGLNNASQQALQTTLSPKAEAELNTAIQQALRQVVRQGTGQANPVADAAAKSADTSVAQQQAQALASTLKSDKPVRINVNVDNRANVAVSQPGQALSANAVAAQTGPSGPSTNATPFRNGERPAQLQAQNALNNPNAQAQVQATTTQAAAATVAGSGERSATRVLGQALSAGQHGSVGGAEATGGSTTAGPASQTQQTAATGKPQQAQAPRAAQQPQPVAQQISVNITKAIAEGMDRISIQLRPENLGRVEVKLNLNTDGRVSAQIIVDRPETLEQLRNDSRNLEKALQEAGLQANAGDLSFNLRNQQENPENSDSDKRMAGNEDEDANGDLEAELASRILDSSLGDIISDTRVDIRA